MTPRSVAAEAATLLVVLAAVVGMYVVVMLGTGSSMARPPSSVSLVLATVVVAVLLQPLYRRTRRWCRRRLAVPDPPLDLIRQLPRSLAAQVPAEQLPSHMVRLLTEGLCARRTELWLHVDGRLRLAAAWPPTAGPEPPGGHWPSGDGPVEVHPIRHAGTEVGRLVLIDPAAERRSTVERRLLATYADQAGEVLVMLARQQSLRSREAELARQAERLRAAQAAQLVAERDERRHVERDLHDGAQQQLIALGLALRLARRQADPSVDRSADRVGAALTDAARLAHRAAAELSRISLSLYPAALNPAALNPAALNPGDLTAPDLTAALHDVAAGLPIPMRVVASPPDAGRHADVECRIALYFVVLEATQNAAKHASAGRIDLRIELEEGRLRVTVADDGAGFAVAATPPGVGLRNARGRLDDVGGELTIASAPGAGTVLTASVPLPDRAGRPLTSR